MHWNHWAARLVGWGVLGVALAGCKQDAEQSETPAPTVTVTLSPRTMDGSATPSTLTVRVTDAQGQAATGSVTVHAAAGVLGTDSADATLTLAAGEAQTTFVCNRAVHATCAGDVRISATWSGRTGGVTASLPAPGSGSTAGDGGSDGGTDGGTPDAGPPPAGADTEVTLALGQPVIYLGIDDSTSVVATLEDADGPVSGEVVVGVEAPGRLLAADGGVSANPATLTTDTDGTATLRVGEAGAQGKATLTATSTASGASARAVVEVSQLSNLTFVGSACAQAATGCDLMGVRTSGFNEVATLSFKLVDVEGRPAVGVPVDFSFAGGVAPGGTTLVPARAETGVDGVVRTTLNAGVEIGVATVRASVAGVPSGTLLAVDALPVGIRGARPSNQGFALQCATHNIPALAVPTDRADLQVTCKAKLVDRFNHPVGTGAPVFFKTEAGTVSPSATTARFTAGAANAAEGTAAAVYSTLGGAWPAQDVAPLPVAAAQWPFAREVEPSYTDAVGIVRNPRDGFVTVLAYAAGEEFFTDENLNGVRDANEPFIDQGEPFVDRDDDGVRGPGEDYVDVNNDGDWDAANGTYDAATVVWTEARIVTSGHVNDSDLIVLAPTPFAGACGTTPLARGTNTRFLVFATDVNLNRPAANVTSVGVSHSASKGSVAFSAYNPDEFGFGYERVLVSAAGTACTPTTPVCHWESRFGEWDDGYQGYVTVTGAATTDVAACVNDTVTVAVTTKGLTVQQTNTGGIE